MEDQEEIHHPIFDPDVAANYVGKYVLIGINHRNSADEIVSKSQDHGEIVELTPSAMIIERPNGERFSLPPEYSQLQVANKGTYHLHGTGETVTDPDYVGFMSIWPAESQGN